MVLITASHSILRTLSSDESRLSHELAYELGSGDYAGTQLRLLGSWMSHLPARVGQSRALDCAIESVVAAHRARLMHGDERSNQARLKSSALRCAAKEAVAISAIREAIAREADSDATLLAVAVLVSTAVYHPVHRSCLSKWRRSWPLITLNPTPCGPVLY